MTKLFTLSTHCKCGAAVSARAPEPFKDCSACGARFFVDWFTCEILPFGAREVSEPFDRVEAA